MAKAGGAACSSFEVISRRRTIAPNTMQQKKSDTKVRSDNEIRLRDIRMEKELSTKRDV